MSAPYYEDASVRLYHGDFRDVLTSIDVSADLLIADPPYGETSLEWDHWPKGWPAEMSAYSRSMWCFGSMRMFLDRRDEFSDWRMSQDVVWEKHNGSGLHSDRFKRVHEHAVFWYQGAWADIHHEAPTTPDATARVVRMKAKPTHHQGKRAAQIYRSEDGGPRLMRSVIYARSMHGRAINETEKPELLLEPLLKYGCAPGGTVLDIFAGSGSTGAAAKTLGMKAVLIEKRESQCEGAARRLSSLLDFGEPA